MKIDGYAQNTDRVIVNIYEFFSPIPLLELVESWKQSSHHIMVTSSFYSFHPSYGAVHKPFWRDLERKYRDIHERGCTMMRIQTGSDWAPAGLALYISTRLMWNPYLEVEPILRDFAEKMFPNASDEAYNLALLFKRSRGEVAYNEFMPHAFSLLERMRNKIKTPEEQLRWDFYASYLTYCHLVDTLGDKVTKPAEKVKEIQLQLAERLKRMDRYQALETHKRLRSLHEQAMSRFAQVPRKEGWEMLRSLPAEPLTHEELVQLVAKARQDYPEPPYLHEKVFRGTAARKGALGK